MALASSEDAHTGAFAIAEVHFAARGWTLDKACKNSNRLCFAGCDSGIRVREDEPKVFPAKGHSFIHEQQILAPQPLSEVSEGSASSVESVPS